MRSAGLALFLAAAVVAQPQSPLELAESGQPVYPPLARLAEVEGSVALNFTLEPDGSVAVVQVASGHPLLRSAARATVESWRFTEGRPAGSNERFRTVLDFVVKEGDAEYEFPDGPQPVVLRMDGPHRGYVETIRGRTLSATDCQDTAQVAPRSPLQPTDFVELERYGCLQGVCPSYVIRLAASGRIDWTGRGFVDEEGNRSKTISPEKARGAMKKFLSSDVWNLCGDYERGLTHGDGSQLTVSVGGATKVIRDYAEAAPLWFRELQAELDQVTDSHRWRHGDPKSEPLYNIDAEYLPKPGLTDLMRAAVEEDLARLQPLLFQGAEVDAVDAGGWTALMYAAAGTYGSAVSPLIAAGADPDHRSHFGDTPLMAAALRGRFDEELAEAGADVNAQNRNGVSALMLLVVSADPEEIKLALKAGADPSLRDGQGRTALDYLREVDCHRNPIRGFKTFLEFAAPCDGFSSGRMRRIRRLLR